MKLMLIAIAALMIGCQQTHQLRNQSDGVMRFRGPLTKVAVSDFLDAASRQNEPIKEIIISSAGGDVEALDASRGDARGRCGLQGGA